MKTIGKVIFAALIILIAFSCKKGDLLPKPTQTGANMMAAKVNGKVWQHRGCIGCMGLRVNYDDRILFGITGDNPDQKIGITLIISSLKSIGTYDLKLEGSNNNFGELYNSKENIIYLTSNSNTGKVTITKIDLTKKIISGTFEFTAEDENNPSNTIRVTDGRFDVPFQ